MEPDSRIGVLHVISGLSLGGAERMLLWSARHHDREHFRMGVVSIMSGGELADEIRNEGVAVYELDQGRGRLSFSAFRRLSGIIRSFGPRILQGHMYHSNVLIRLAGALMSGTAVLSTRHIDAAPLVRRIVNGATGFLNSGTLVFSQRVFDEENKENLFRRPVRLVHYGIEVPAPFKEGSSPGVKSSELREKLGIPPDAFLWMAMGRLTKQKGFPVLFEAFTEVAGSADDPRLLIVGDGEDREKLQVLAARSGLEGKVIFTGPAADPVPYLSASDGFVLSSRSEGGPLVLLEAMAAGLPVVSTRVGDAPSMVQDGQTGLLVDAGDAGLLAEAMKQVQGMGPEAVVWGERGRRRVEEMYDFSRTQREVEAYYRELLIGSQKA